MRLSVVGMYVWFWICVLCMFIAAAFHHRSVEHTKLQKKYGKERGTRIGKTYGTISGTMELTFLIGLWISPQPRYTIPILPNLTIPIADYSVPIVHLIISLPIVLFGAWIAIKGVKATGLEASETHSKPEKLQTTGAYSVVRHPQYLGWILAQIGMSILLSAWYSTLFTPILTALIYLISKKEEDELTKEFGQEYKEYQKKVPMLIPKFRKYALVI